MQFDESEVFSVKIEVPKSRYLRSESEIENFQLILDELKINENETWLLKYAENDRELIKHFGKSEAVYQLNVEYNKELIKINRDFEKDKTSMEPMFQRYSWELYIESLNSLWRTYKKSNLSSYVSFEIANKIRSNIIDDFIDELVMEQFEVE